MSRSGDIPEAGFTLVEIIVSLLVAVILGAVMLQYLGGALTRSSTPMKRLAADAALQGAADSIIGAFRQEAPTDIGTWNDFQTAIGAPGTDQNNAFGRYRVHFNAFIQFDPDGNESADVFGTAPENILKVSISETGGNPLTFLLIR